jgi:nitrogen-specific signal transduction histidine kinase
MNAFQYSQVGQKLIEKVSQKVEQEKSVVLLAARFGGKRHVVNRVRALLEATGIGPIVEVRLLTETPLTRRDHVKRIISQSLAANPIDFDFHETGGPELLEPIERLSNQVGRPVILFATNVDGISHHLARSFLQNARDLVERHKLVAVLTGEDDLRPLVVGENSDFECAEPFVLQGYDLEEFTRFINDYLKYLSLTFEPREQLIQQIWRLTGGNIYVLRMVLWGIIQSRCRSDISPAKPVTIDDLPSTVKLAGIPGVYGQYVFRHAAQIIARDPNSWVLLEKLINDQPAEIPPSDAPTRLELAGMAIRKSINGVNQLVLSSPLMEIFAKSYYDATRLGDLYGLNGQWDKAVDWYKQLSREARMRPINSDDKRAVGYVINALTSTLQERTTIPDHANALNVITTLERLFADGAHYILGFLEVTFWRRSSTQQGDWELRRGETSEIEGNTLKKIQIYLPFKPTLPAGVFHLERAGKNYGLAVQLTSSRPDEQLVVVVSDFGAETTINREPDRERLISHLLNSFSKAYSHAVFVDHQRALQRIRSVHMDIINNIFTSLLSWQLNVKRLLDLAASELVKKLGYKRVVFSLIDSKRRNLEGISENTESPFKIIDQIKGSLDDPSTDVHLIVINTKKFEIIENTASDLTVDRNLAKLARIRALGVAPLLNQQREAIGTILIERHNNTAPSDQEMKDLQYFCGQVAIAIEHCERVNMLEACLNGIPEPLVIFDGTENRRYQNKSAAELLGGKAGWLAANQVAQLSGPETESVRDVVHQALTARHRVANNIALIGESLDYKGEAIADTIEDWRGENVGALLRIQDRTYLHQYLSADQLVAKGDNPSTVVSNILDAVKQIGYKWARLYLVRKNDGTEQFVSERSFGHSNPQYEMEFNEHRVILAPRSEKTHKDWLCIDYQSPVVFCWWSELAEDEIYITPYGLKAINWPSPSQPVQVQKNEGDFWVDFPLISNKQALGKICLQCSETFRPEQFELLKYLSNSFAGIFDASKRGVEREQSAKLAAAKKTMATMAHNLGTRHGSFPFLLRRYRNREALLPDLKTLNDEFEDVTNHLFETITRAKDLVAEVNVTSHPTNLLELIQRTFSAVINEGIVTLEGDNAADQLVIPVDRHLMEMALHELVQNSREAIPAGETPKIKITINRNSVEGLGWLDLVYEDNGPGISTEFRARVFDVEDSFSRRPHRRSAGTGLGMNFISRVIMGHGGKIRYIENAGKGAAFLITLPTGLLAEE